MLISFHLLPFYVIFNAEFVGPDAWNETLGPRSYESCRAVHTEQENGTLQDS